MKIDEIETNGPGAHLGIFVEIPQANHLDRRRISAWVSQQIRSADGSAIVVPTPRGVQIEWSLDRSERVERAAADLDWFFHGHTLEISSAPEVGVDLESLLTTLALEPGSHAAGTVNLSPTQAEAVIGLGADIDADMLRTVIDRLHGARSSLTHGAGGPQADPEIRPAQSTDQGAAGQTWVNVPGHSGTVLRVASPMDPPRDRYHALVRSMSNAVFGGTPESVIVKHFAEDLRLSYAPFSRLAESEGTQWWFMDADTGPGYEQDLFSAVREFLTHDVRLYRLEGRMKSAARTMVRGTEAIRRYPTAAVQSRLACVNGFDPWRIGDATREELNNLDIEDVRREIMSMLDGRRRRIVVISQFAEPTWFSA